MNKINVKDLINIGVFTALYLVLFFMASFLGYVPVLFPALPVICAAVVGIHYFYGANVCTKCNNHSIVRYVSIFSDDQRRESSN